MKKMRLVVLDVDGTLLTAVSSWKFLHEKFGTWDKGEQYAERFFQGAISYAEWAKLDASLWSGLKLESVIRAIDSIPYTQGAKAVITTLRAGGLKVVLLSAGLSLVTKRIEREIGVDGTAANVLEFKNGYLTGEVAVKVSMDNKDRVLEDMLERYGLTFDECAAVGDDETLLPLFQRVNISIAFNPRSSVVAEKADYVVKSDDLREVLPLLLS